MRRQQVEMHAQSRGSGGSAALRHGILLFRLHSRQTENGGPQGSQDMSQLLDTSAKGVYTISATPFTDAGDIDWPSVDSLVEFYLQCGVQGLTVLGMMGEAQKLSDQESAEFTRYFLRCVNGRVPVIVGVSNPGTSNLVKLSRIAM